MLTCKLSSLNGFIKLFCLRSLTHFPFSLTHSPIHSSNFCSMELKRLFLRLFFGNSSFANQNNIKYSWKRRENDIVLMLMRSHFYPLLIPFIISSTLSQLDDLHFKKYLLSPILIILLKSLIESWIKPSFLKCICHVLKFKYGGTIAMARRKVMKCWNFLIK